MGLLQVLSLQVRVSLRVMAMKVYSTFPQTPEQEPQMAKCCIQDTCGGGFLHICRNVVGKLYSSNQLGNMNLRYNCKNISL